MFLYAIAASFISLALTLAIAQTWVGLSILGIIVASWLTGFILLYGFTKAENRVPEPKEFKHFYIIYASMCALALFAVVLLAGTNLSAWNVWVNILIDGVAYPVFIRSIFNQDKVKALLEKNQRKSIR